MANLTRPVLLSALRSNSKGVEMCDGEWLWRMVMANVLWRMVMANVLWRIAMVIPVMANLTRPVLLIALEGSGDVDSSLPAFDVCASWANMYTFVADVEHQTNTCPSSDSAGACIEY